MPNVIPVDDPADLRLEHYRAVRERDLVGRAGLFLAEGKVVIEKLVASPAHRLVSILIAAHRVESMAALLSRLAPETPVFAASQPVIDALAGFPLHRGLIAVGRRVDPPEALQLLKSLPERATILVLAGIANHDNMGGIFRNAAAFGVDAILLDGGCCDPLYRKAIRVSVGAALLVPFARMNVAKHMLTLLAAYRFRTIGLSPSGMSTLGQLPFAARNAVLLGAEGPGLSGELLERTYSVRIPMAADFDSLNVATTSGIVLHHLAAMSDQTGVES